MLVEFRSIPNGLQGMQPNFPTDGTRCELSEEEGKRLTTESPEYFFEITPTVQSAEKAAAETSEKIEAEEEATEGICEDELETKAELGPESNK